MTSRKTIRLCRHFTTLLLAGASTAALAQAAEPAPAATSIASDEIVVTAQKRTERLQDVPVSVSVVGGDALAKSKVTQVDELVGRVPNLQLTATVGDNTPIFALRGVSMSDYSLNQASPVATYYDEVYKGNFAFLGVAMYDLERVEVLRGPQGTLYGKNTTGGAVNLISRAPKLDETSGYANVGYGNYNRIDLNGAINLPLGDKAALRIAGTYAKADGWFKNVVPGQPDLAGTSEYGIRASLLFEPSDGMKFVLRASTSFQNPTNYGIYAQPTAINRPGLTDFQIASDVPDKRRARTYSVALTSTFDIGHDLTITSVTAWDKGSLSFKEDTDGTATKLLEIPYVDRANQFAQDLRLSSDFKGPFNFILGAYFNREKVFNETTFQIATDTDFDGIPGETAADCAIGFPLACQFRNSFDQVKKSYAVYSDASFEITDRLKLRGGLRFTHDTGVQNFFGSDALGADNVLVTNLIPLTVLKYKTNNLSGKIGLDYKLAGVLPWTTRPARLRVPAAIGLVSLNVDGSAVARVERHGDQLTLGEAAAAQRASDSVALRVYRRLQDGLPALLETRLQLNVTGTAREQLLGPALPTGFVATALAGELPARLEGDGRLRVQLRPGNWTVTLLARSTGALSKVTLQLPPAPWPRQEIWSYADDTTLRSTRVEGSPIDTAQVGVPGEWRELPAFALDDSAGLTIETGSRGDEGGRGDQLRLQRQLWLDFDGGGVIVADQLSGQLRHHQRLDVTAPWQLQRVAQNGDPLLITRGEHGDSGVELRDQQIHLDAGLRLPTHAGALPSSGWQVPLEGIDATLHLPYGYRLLGAIGADRSPDSWVGQWNLLDLFVVALIALLAGRLLGWPWALLAAGYLVLAQHEAAAPLWTLAVALALALLLRALPEGRLRVFARVGAIAVFALVVLWTLPFAARQLEYALHPQLEGSHSDRFVSAGFAAPPPVEEVAQDLMPPPPAAPAVVMEKTSNSSTKDVSSVESDQLGSTITRQPQASLPLRRGGSSVQVVDTRSVIQAGPGMPQWNMGNNYRLGWSGPVTSEQTTRLVIAPAWLVRLLRVAMVGLLIAVLARLATTWWLPLRGRWRDWRAGHVVGALLLGLALLPNGAHAQAVPSQPLLDQLRNRLTEAPKCAPDCAELAQAQLQVSGDTLELELEAHVGAPVALPLPGADDTLQLLDVAVDGHAGVPLTRRGEQLLLRLDRGVHRVSLSYRIGATDTASLRFALRPQRVSFAGTGWTLDGVDEGRALGDSIALHRTQVAGNGKSLPTAQSFPPYVRLTRTLQLGVDWTVLNTVERIAPREGGFSTTLPLLPGEHPLGDGLPVEKGHISITFNANSNAVSWTSRLDHAATLSLTAPALGERAEVWQVDAAPMWHVDATGVPASANDIGQTYQPLPGEVLHLAFTQPVAAPGDSLAFDDADAASTVGSRATETTLTLRARSTRGGEHAITLPPGAELLEAQRDGESINLAVRDGKLSLPLLPGAHQYTLRLREPRGIAASMRTPAFALHAPVANINLNLQLPQDRWVLWTWGPTVGPAVLYWSQLIVLLLASWLLARVAPTPLRFRHWLLLGLGFAAFAWSAYALVVLWLILLGLRARGAPAERLGRNRFNLLQLGLAALTVLALAVLISAVPSGLLGLPDMHVAGNDSSAWNLRWFADQSVSALPVGGVLSVSLWVYKIAMLAWALWLANALIGWLRWGFEGWTRGGYWRRREPKPVAAPPPVPTAEGSSPDA